MRARQILIVETVPILTLRPDLMEFVTVDMTLILRSRAKVQMHDKALEIRVLQLTREARRELRLV